MARHLARLSRACFFSLLAMLINVAGQAETLTLKNGMTLEGSLGLISSLGAADPLKPSGAGEIQLSRILVVDDQLTRTFVAKSQVVANDPAPAIGIEKISVPQRVATVGRPVVGVGAIIRNTPFDEFGRRIFTMKTVQGRLDIVQGITEVTPKWTKVEAIQGANSYIWSMRIATSSIPREQLSKILYRVIDPKNSEQRLRIVRLYLQSERFQEARAELDQLLKEFPDLAPLKEQVKVMHQLGAQRLLKEIELRRDAGQYRLAISMLEQFPADGVAGETLLKVREMLDELADLKSKGDRITTQLPQHVAQLKEDTSREQVKEIVEEIVRELNVNTIDRLADYLRLADDASLSAEQKLSLAISGWLLGSGSAVENLAVSKSLVQVRGLVRKYLVATIQPERDAILQELESLEGATQEYIAKLIAHMKPPLATAIAGEEAEAGNPVAGLESRPEAVQPEADKPPGEPEGVGPPAALPSDAQEDGIPGLLELDVKSKLSEDPQIKYWVQLPPEYDPYRRYPCVVTLNGAGTTPLEQIDWWAGAFVPQDRARYGQASRHGYVVIAPRWTREHQRKYEYSAREHNAVLLALRDAGKRFAIDTDRVFLSGHSMGGDAAWDIGLAHPDLWAGVIPIVAMADKYVTRYWENGRHLPMYFVCGEKDGSGEGNKMVLNAVDWDRYLKDFRFDTMVVQYQGRGHEHFHDEIQNLFTWMNLHRRNFFLREFKAYSLRPWDNFFWWVEAKQPKETTVILPAEWGNGPKSAKTALPAEIDARVLETNGVTVRAGAFTKVTVWLSPEVVSFEGRPPTVRIKGQAQNKIERSIAILLEDVRTRGDRQHPFWAKVEY